MENKLGQKFTFRKIHYITKKDTQVDGCMQCCFRSSIGACRKPEKAGECIGKYRTDGKDTHFEIVPPEKRKGRKKCVDL